MMLIGCYGDLFAFFRNKPEGQEEESGSSDIITLVLVVCLFISCNVLVSFLSFTTIIFQPLTVNFLELLFMIANSYLIDLSNLMVVVNSSCNFLIYYAFGSHFRRTLKVLFFQTNICKFRLILVRCYNEERIIWASIGCLSWLHHQRKFSSKSAPSKLQSPIYHQSGLTSHIYNDLRCSA